MTRLATRLWLAVYLAVAVFTFGNYMASPRFCTLQRTNPDWSVTYYEEPCRPYVEAGLASVLWPIYWPLRLSWELQQ